MHARSAPDEVKARDSRVEAPGDEAQHILLRGERIAADAFPGVAEEIELLPVNLYMYRNLRLFKAHSGALPALPEDLAQSPLQLDRGEGFLALPLAAHAEGLSGDFRERERGGGPQDVLERRVRKGEHLAEGVYSRNARQDVGRGLSRDLFRHLDEDPVPVAEDLYPDAGVLEDIPDVAGKDADHAGAHRLALHDNFGEELHDEGAVP